MREPFDRLNSSCLLFFFFLLLFFVSFVFQAFPKPNTKRYRSPRKTFNSASCAGVPTLRQNPS